MPGWGEGGISRNWVPIGSRVRESVTYLAMVIGGSLLPHLHGATLLFPQEARLERVVSSSEFMFLIGSNYKGPQGDPGRRERTWERQRFTATPTIPTCHPLPHKYMWKKVPDPLNNAKKP